MGADLGFPSDGVQLCKNSSFGSGIIAQLLQMLVLRRTRTDGRL